LKQHMPPCGSAMRMANLRMTCPYAHKSPAIFPG
jgi:hypothetical protein